MQTKKLHKERAAIYNPNKDLWRHANGGSNSESPVCITPLPYDEENKPDRGQHGSFARLPQPNHIRVNSLHDQRRRESSYYMDHPKARDSLNISQPASLSRRPALSVFMCPPKARDSLLINQPASSQKSFSKPQVQFVPQVHFAQSPNMNLNKPGINGSPLKKTSGMSKSPGGIASAVGDEVISNLISAWYWTGFYAGYKGSVSEK